MEKMIGFLKNRVSEQKLNFICCAAILSFAIFFRPSVVSAQAPDETTVSGIYADAMPVMSAIPRSNNMPRVKDNIAAEQTKIKVYPDPVSDYLLVLCPLVSAGTKVSVINAEGKIVVTETLVPGATTAVIDVKNIPNGFYVLVFESKTEKHVMKFVKS